MKLFLVERRKEWAGRYRSFAVGAQNEGQAPRLAYEALVPSSWDEDDKRQCFAAPMIQYAWIGEFLDPDKCTSTEIVMPDAPTIIHTNYTGG